MSPNKFVSFLEAAGKDIEKSLAAIMPIAVGAEPLVNAAFPGFGVLYNTTVGVVMAVEQKWFAIGQQSGTGTQKLADAVSILGSLVKQIYSVAGHDVSDAEVTEYINAVVALLNALPGGIIAQLPAPAVAAASKAKPALVVQEPAPLPSPTPTPSPSPSPTPTPQAAVYTE